MPCSTLEAIIAPNIQLAGNFISRSSSAAATAAATSTASSSGEAIVVASDGADGGNAGQRQHQRQRRGQDDHAHGLHHGDRGTSAPFSAASIVICDSAPGLPASNAEVRSQP